MTLNQEMAKTIGASIIFLSSFVGLLFSFYRSGNCFSFYIESLYTSLFFTTALFCYLPTISKIDDSLYNRNTLIITIVFVFLMVIELLSRYFSNKMSLKPPSPKTNHISNLSQMQTILIPYLENNGTPATLYSHIFLIIKLFLSSCFLGIIMGITQSELSIFLVLMTLMLNKFLDAFALGAHIKCRVNTIIYWIISVFYSMITPAFTFLSKRFFPFENKTAVSVCDSVSCALFGFIAYSHCRRLFLSPYQYGRGEMIGITSFHFIGFLVPACLTILVK